MHTAASGILYTDVMNNFVYLDTDWLDSINSQSKKPKYKFHFVKTFWERSHIAGGCPIHLAVPDRCYCSNQASLTRIKGRGRAGEFPVGEDQ